MTDTSAASGFSLLDEEWIPVLDAGGVGREVSLLGLFEEAADLRMIACELPTQTFALLRLALAILHRATDGPSGELAWQRLWHSSGLPLADIKDYLEEYRHRFDLLHPTQPFFQVADLRTSNNSEFGLERLIADVPAGLPFMTTRANSGMESISAAEAARWVVHCQAYDTSGIKTGAVGDPRVQGGRGYPQGVGPLGAIGGVYLEGSDLRETLLLNLLPVAPGWQPDDDRDKPVWERDPHSAVEEPVASRGPYGLLSLYTWQARRIRLFGDRDGLTGAMISYGDRLDLQDMQSMEPMSVWGRSGPREKGQKRVPIYLPRPHDHTRSLWRGLETLLPPPTSAGAEPPQRLSPLIIRWMAHLTRNRLVDQQFRVRPRATSVTYGTKGAVVDEVFSDSLTMNVLLLVEDSALRTTAVDAAADADAAVRALRSLAINLARAAGGDRDSGEDERAAERGYALLDRAFRDWLSRLGPDSDAALARAEWQTLVSRAIARVGADLVAAAGPTAWVGRNVTDRTGRETYYSSSQAEAWFRVGLVKALPMAFPKETEEVAA